jgi:hypothetical protein
VTQKHDAANDIRGRYPENGLGLHYSRFSPISASRLLSDQLLAGRKFQNSAANRPSQANGAGRNAHYNTIFAYAWIMF